MVSNKKIDWLKNYHFLNVRLWVRFFIKMMTSTWRVQFITALIFMHANTVAESVSPMSGILRLWFVPGRGRSDCHECLVNVGFSKLYLIQARKELTLYWVEGHSGILTLFLYRCHSKDLCIMHVALSTQDTTDGPKMTLAQQSINLYKHANVEMALGSLTEPMLLQPRMLRQFRSNVYWKQEATLFEHKKKGKMPILFEEELIRMTPIKNKNIVLEAVPEASLSLIIEDEEDADFPTRCMIIPTLFNDDVCRECLAMHSKSFAIQSFVLFYKKKKAHSAELLVFPSNYKISAIKSNCRRNLCSSILSWDNADCKIMDLLFPAGRTLSEMDRTKHDSNKEYELRNQYATDSREINQVLDVIAIKRMPRAGKVSVMSHHPFEFSNALQMFRSKQVLCINITLNPNKKWDCIGCILRNVRGARLVQFSSLRKATIFTSNIEQRLACLSCGNITLLDQDECRKYLRKAIVTTETYPKLPGKNMLDQLRSNCMVLFYVQSYQLSCVRCMKQSFDTDTDPYILTVTSSLVDTSKLHPELKTSSFQKLLGCHNNRQCIRIQKVPDIFCSEHAFFLLLESSPSIPRADVIKTTEQHCPVGIWPPQKHRILLSQSEIEGPSEMGPDFSNRIALVQFEYAESTFLECIYCLLENAEVFFVYNAEPASNGYVWMRQTSSNNLRICIEKSCSSLSFEYHRKQTKRPIGIRQITRRDINDKAKK